MLTLFLMIHFEEVYPSTWISSPSSDCAFSVALNMQIDASVVTFSRVFGEKDTDATEMGNKMNPYLRPSTKEYIPVIITNSDIDTVDQKRGLVTFNIEYTLAHKVITQRN